MPLFDDMYYDENWSVWDTWRAFGRNCFGYVITAVSRIGNVITAQERRGQVVTTQERRGKVITAGG